MKNHTKQTINVLNNGTLQINDDSVCDSPWRHNAMSSREITQREGPPAN